MHFFYYIAFIATVICAKAAVFVVPGLAEAENYKKMFKDGVNYWTYRLYMEELRAVDSNTYHALIVFPNLMWILTTVILLLWHWGWFA